jgi:chemotaxis protein histidine kinase CheA
VRKHDVRLENKTSDTMSRLKKLIKTQSHQQFALQQLSTESRVSEEIKQFHTEQIEFADRDGVVKALNFLLSLVKSTAIPVSDQIRSQVSKLVSLIRIRDELQLHAQIHKRELGNEIPLMLTGECPIEFPDWDEIFVMLKMKKFSITFMEDHRARQELIASVLRREAEIERKKAMDAEVKAAIHAQKEAAEQLATQKTLVAAKEKSQRALDAAKEKEQRALDAAKEKHQQALVAAKEKEQQELEAAMEKEQRALDANYEKEQRKLEAAKKKEKQLLEAAEAEDQQHLQVMLKEQQRLERAKLLETYQLNSAKDRKSAVLSQDTTQQNYLNQKSSNKVQKLKIPDEDSKIYEALIQKIDFGIVEESLTSFQDCTSSPIEIVSSPSQAPCQSPKSIEHTPRHFCNPPREPEVIIHSKDSVSFPRESMLDVLAPMQANTELPGFESEQLNPHYGPWRPFVSSSRYLPTVGKMEMNVSPYELALNLSCLTAVRSFPALHVATNLKNKPVDLNPKCSDFGEICVPKHLLERAPTVPHLHQTPINVKLLEDMDFEEVQVDRSLRALRRFTESANKISMCAYDEILQHQKKLISLLLPIVQKHCKGDEKITRSPPFDFTSHSHQNSDSVDASTCGENFSKTNRLPLKTNLAAQRRQVLLAKCSSSKFSSAQSLSSNSADILHLESIANSITNHNRGDPALWKSAKRTIEFQNSQKRGIRDDDCEPIMHEVRASFGLAQCATKSLLLGNFAQEIRSSLNRSFRERYSATGRSVKR